MTNGVCIFFKFIGVMNARVIESEESGVRQEGERLLIEENPRCTSIIRGVKDRASPRPLPPRVENKNSTVDLLSRSLLAVARCRPAVLL